jgi:hypothetical protein
VFLRNVRGVAFYAVPHAGASNIATYVNKLLRCKNRHNRFYAVPYAGASNIATYVNKLLRCKNRHNRGIMDNIQPWQRDMEQLSQDFDGIVHENEINICAFCEGRPMENVVRMCWMK